MNKIKKSKKEDGINRSISVPAFLVCVVLAALSFLVVLNLTSFPIRILMIMLCVLFTICSILFLAITFYRNNVFFNVILIALIQPILWIFSLLINLFYMALVPLAILILMIIIGFTFYLIIGVSLLQVGIDGNNKAILYISTLLVILLYYYFADKLYRLFSTLYYTMISNEYSKSKKRLFEKIFDLESNRKILYLLLLFIYIIIKFSYFSEFKFLLQFEFINEALLTFVIYDTLVGGNNKIINIFKKSN